MFLFIYKIQSILQFCDKHTMLISLVDNLFKKLHHKLNFKQLKGLLFLISNVIHVLKYIEYSSKISSNVPRLLCPSASP